LNSAGGTASALKYSSNINIFWHHLKKYHKKFIFFNFVNNRTQNFKGIFFHNSLL
jgi:hypothetical protein